MTERVWEFQDGQAGQAGQTAHYGTAGRPPTPSSPPIAPTRNGQVGQPPILVQGATPPGFGSSPPQSPGIAGPPLFGAGDSQTSVQKSKPRWDLRLLAAFVAGGMLSGGGFALGQLVANDSVVEAQPSASPALSPATTQALPDIVLTPPDPDATEPAAFVAAVLGPSIVQIETELGVGSGIVFDEGLVMTNHHVIDNATRIRVRTADGRTLPATLVGSDPQVDVAVLDVGPDSGLAIAQLAVGEELQVGQAAFALGSPFELQQSISAGIVSAINRPVANAAGGINAMIQSDTSVNPGNSGGALADRSGRVIGINTSIRTDGVVQGSVGISFSIPIDTAMRVIDRILAGESLEPGFLGVGNPQAAPGGESGVVIGEVTEGSGADQAGIQVGDRLIRIEGSPVTSLGELAGLVRAHFPGDVVELEIVRGDEHLLIEATLGER